jgi:hypothetical protein
MYNICLNSFKEEFVCGNIDTEVRFLFIMSKRELSLYTLHYVIRDSNKDIVKTGGLYYSRTAMAHKYDVVCDSISILPSQKLYVIAIKNMHVDRGDLSITYVKECP